MPNYTFFTSKEVQKTGKSKLISNIMRIFVQNIVQP